MTRNLLLASMVASMALAGVAAADTDWPREIVLAEGTVTLYQPQIDRLAGNRIEGRAAVSWRAAEGEPVFGAVWLTARLETDRNERRATLAEVRVPQVRFADASEEDKTKLAALLEREIPRWELEVSLDEILSDEGAAAAAPREELRHEPPEILISTEPAVLVRIDGEPRFEPLEGTIGADFERIVNTPFPIVRERSSGRLYLAGGAEAWFVAEDVSGPWQAAGSVPAAIQGLVELDAGGEPATEATATDAAPKIVVTTEEAELVVFAGEPTWAPVQGTSELLYADNTNADVFLEISTQAYYLLLSGRWFRAAAVEGDREWVWVANDRLPEAFSDIAEESVNGAVLPHVAGTVQAREAVLDAAIPQTAAIRRDAADVEIEFDGEPSFEMIAGATAEVEVAVNTPQSVFKVGDRYFLCEQGVWFESASATGPWMPATAVPEAIYSIPPSSPHHNVTYVRVYDVTPQVVYVGYTPGYTHSYVSHGCVVYGTGWAYRPWYGPHYYPRPWTWGVNVRYDPWYGWGFGISYSNGPFTISFGNWGYRGGYRPPYYGWWGPGGYRPYPRPVPYRGYRKPPRPRPMPLPATRPAAGRPGAGRPATFAGPNLYDRPGARDRLAARPAPAERPRPSVARERPNDVLTDRDGNVYRRTGDGRWQQRESGRWQDSRDLDRSRPAARPPQPSTRPMPPSARPARPSTRPAAPRPQLERDYRSRQRGQQRAQQVRGRQRGPSR